MSKDCCIPNNKQNKKKVYDTFLIGVIAATILLLAVVVFLGSKLGATTQVTSDNQAVLSVDSNRYDWGTIDLGGGIVSKNFLIKNTGNAMLKLYDVKTSCLCTTAQLKTAEQLSRKYGMHEKSTDVFEVKPGKTAELIVEFDPAFHGPSGIGPISRTVTINTNATKTPELTFYLTADVVKK